MAYTRQRKWWVVRQRQNKISDCAIILVELTSESEEKGSFVGLDLGLNNVGLPPDCVLSTVMCNVSCCGHIVTKIDNVPQFCPWYVKVVGWLVLTLAWPQ